MNQKQTKFLFSWNVKQNISFVVRNYLELLEMIRMKFKEQTPPRSLYQIVTINTHLKGLLSFSLYE